MAITSTRSNDSEPPTKPVEQQQLRLEEYIDAKHELLKQEVEPSPSVTRHESLYKKFRKMKLTKFDGSMNPDEADEWLHSN